MLERVKKDWRHAEVGTSIRGPFLVKKKISEISFLLQVDPSGKEKLVHHNKLKPYEGDSPPNWLRKAKRKLLRSKEGQGQYT